MISWTVAHQAPLFMEFSRQEFWAGCHFLLQGIFLTQESNPCLLNWQVDSTYFRSVEFSCSVMSNSLQPHGRQNARPPCPSPIPRAYSKSCSLSRWCHPNISSSVIPFSSHPQSLPESGSFQMSQFFISGSQSIRVSASTSVLPMNIQDWFLLGFTYLAHL